MKITKRILTTIKKLADGDSVTVGQMPKDLGQVLEDNGLVIVYANGRRNNYRASNREEFRETAEAIFGIKDLEAQLDLMERDTTSRAEAVTATGDSKTRKVRTFTGFLVNCYDKIEAELKGRRLELCPPEGSFVFISDYLEFKIPNDVLIVGIENAENFRYIQHQQHFFEREIPNTKRILFVSRYPQEQSTDLITWLKSIPNRYVHFGDLDLAGVRIYLTEYYAKLGEKSSFLIPSDYKVRLDNGSVERYNTQLASSPLREVADPRVRPLVEAIHTIHKGYDQEGYIEGL